MQVGQRIDDRCHHDENLGQRKALLRLLPSQDFQVRAFNILHEQIGPLTLLTIEHTIDAGQCPVMKLLEQLPFVDEPIPVLPARVNNLLERNELSWNILISHAVDSSEPAPA